MHLISGISIGLSKMVPLIGCPPITIPEKRVNYELKRERLKRERKNEFHKSLFVDLTSTILIVKYT